MPLEKLSVTGLDDKNQRRRLPETLNKILDHQFDDSRRQTNTEKTLGVTPISPAFEPGDMRRYDVAADGTDQTSKIVNALSALGASYDGPLTVPAQVKFDTQAVLDAMPDKAVMYFENTHQNGPSGYRQQIVGFMSKAPDAGTDTTVAIVDPHNVSFGLINPRTAGTTSGNNGLATIGWYRGFYTKGTKGPRNQLQAQFGKSPVRLAQGVGSFSMAMLAPERAGNYEVWEAGEAITTGDYRVSSTFLFYRATSTGTTGPTEPSHTSGTASDGGVTWAYESTSFFTTFYVDEQRRIGTNFVGNGVTNLWEQGVEDPEDFIIRWKAVGTSKPIYLEFHPTDGGGSSITAIPFVRVNGSGIKFTASGFARDLVTFADTAATLNNATFETFTATDLADAAHAVNTANKFAGKIVRDGTNNKLVMAGGSAAGSVWSNIADGTAVYSPV